MWIISYWVLPIISALMWLAMLLALFIHWEVIGHPHYPSMEPNQKIAYISDTGAYTLKPLFIAGAVVTTVFLDLAFISERWLRHIGRLAPNTSRTQKLLAGFSIAFAIGGSLGLILLSIFDTYHYPRLHDGFLLLFIAGFVLSAICICAEYQRLGIHYRHHRVLRMSFWVKLTFILLAVGMAIVFVGTGWTHHKNIAAVFEWLIAIVFTGYILSFVLDLLPSVHTKHHVPQGFKDIKRVEQGENKEHGMPQEGEKEENLTNDSAGPKDNVTGGDRRYGAPAEHGGDADAAVVNGEAASDDTQVADGDGELQKTRTAGDGHMVNRDLRNPNRPKSARSRSRRSRGVGRLFWDT